MSNHGPIIKAFNRVIAGIREQLEGKLDIGGVVDSASKLAAPVSINISGDGTASGSSDGSTPFTLSLSLGLTGVLAGTYPVVTVDAKGRVTTGRALQASDVPTLNQNTSGNAATATRWATARNVSITGDGSWAVSLDGSANASGALTLANSGVVAGTYAKVTVDAKGRVTNGAALAATDIPDLDADKITSGVLAAARIPTLNQNTTGSAARWTTARAITITGDGSWTVSLDGSAGVSAALTLANTGVVAGTYGKVTVDAKGRVTAGTSLLASDIPSLDTGKLTTGILPIARGGTGGGTQGDARTALGIGSMATRNVTISTAAPSGGADGDVWFQY